MPDRDFVAARAAGMDVIDRMLAEHAGKVLGRRNLHAMLDAGLEAALPLLVPKRRVQIHIDGEWVDVSEWIKSIAKTTEETET